MKKLEIPQIASTVEFENKAINEKIENCNWSAEFPYSPKVEFKIAHTKDSILLKYSVCEDYVMANVCQDNGQVWTDSCVEFFITFDDSGYYNFEFTCIGKMLLGFRQSREQSIHADDKVLSLIKRQSSLGTECFAEVIKEGQQWEINIEIPKEAFFKHNFSTLCGVSARANFYKCGDNLSKPHFLSWSPIGTPSPDFHRPEYFGELNFL